MELRPLGSADAALVEDAFVLTADWRPGSERGAEHWRADPVFDDYTAGWGRLGDGGVVSASPSGRESAAAASGGNSCAPPPARIPG